MVLLKMVLAIYLSVFILAGCAVKLPDSAASSAASMGVTSAAGSAADASPSAPATAMWSLSVDEAASLYMAQYPDTVITSIELDKSRGSYFYSVNGVDDNTGYEVNINTQTKELHKGREEALDAEDKNGVKKTQQALDLATLLPFAEIVGIAEQAAGKGAAVECKLEKELGIQVWDVTVQDGLLETEVTINAETGEVLQTERHS